MRKLLKYLRNYKKESVIGPLFKMTEAVFELLVPIVMAKIVDVGIKNRDMHYVMMMCIVMVLLGLLGLACSLTAQFFAAKAAVGFGTELRGDMYAHINSLSYREIDEIGTSTLVTRITSDINQAQTGVNMALRLFLRSPFIVVGAVIMSFTISIKLSLIFVIMVPVLSVIIFGIMGKCIPLYKKVQKKLDRVLLSTRENLTGARVVRSFSRQPEELSDFEEQTDDLTGIQIYVGKIAALMNPMTYVVVNAAIAVVLWYGGKEVYIGGITQGELMALINYMTQILVALVAFAGLISNVTKAFASAGRINEIFAVNSSMEEGAERLSERKEVAVDFHNVTFHYGEAEESALNDITFTARTGETIGIIGGTGSGKSSLVNLIPRFYDVTEGSVSLFQKDVRTLRKEEINRLVGVVPQKAILFSGTIRDNMKWGKKDATDEEIWKALEIAQAKEFVEQKEDGLDSYVTQNGENLSGGQRQRLTIARALVKKPAILILDDSASALDFATDAALRKAISENTENTTVFIVSQRATTIKNADKIIVLDDGEVAGIGTHKELLRSCEIYREICLSQLSKEEVQAYEK